MPSKLHLPVIVLLAVLWAGAVTASVNYGAKHSWLLWLDHWSADWRTLFLSDKPETQHPRLALVVVTEETLQDYPYRAPVDRELLARLVSTLDAAGASTIGIDFLFLKATEPDKDEKLVRAIRAAKARIVIAAADKRVSLIEPQARYQTEFLTRTGAVAGYANLHTGRDHVVRYVAAPDDPAFPKSFAVQLARPDALRSNSPRRIAWLLRPSSGNDRFFTIPAHLLASGPDKPPNPAAAAVAALLTNRIVLIGADLAAIDRHQTPLANWQGDDEMPGVKIQAQVAAQLLDGRSITPVGDAIFLTAIAVLTLTGLWLGFQYGTLGYTLYFGATTLAVAAFDAALFIAGKQFIPFGACMATLVAGLIGGLLLRQIPLRKS